MVGLLLAPAILLGDPGFGALRKKKVDLEIRQPAAVRLSNASVGFKASAANPAYSSVQESLLATLETEILGNEKTLMKKPNPAEADWILGLRVTGFSVAEPKQRTDTIGKNGVTYIRWTGSLHAAYQVLDHAGRSHAAGNVDYSYDKEYQTGGTVGKGTLSRIPIPGKKKSATAEQVPQTTADVQQILIHHVVDQIAMKLGNTKHPVEVQIAGGDDHLNRAAEFIERRLWARALEELEKTTPYAKPESEAYRQYDLGLVYEAMSYDAKTFNDQKANLLAAQEYYDKAMESNRKEKYFVDTVARMKDAMARYKAFEGMQKEDQKQSQAPPQPPPQKAQPKVVAQATTSKPPSPAAQTPKPVAAKSATAKSPAKTIKIGDVIEMFSSGVPEGQIVDIIQHSPVVFDPLDKDTAVATAKARLPITIQNELRKKVGAPLLPASPVAAPPKK